MAAANELHRVTDRHAGNCIRALILSVPTSGGLVRDHVVLKGLFCAGLETHADRAKTSQHIKRRANFAAYDRAGENHENPFLGDHTKPRIELSHGPLELRADLTSLAPRSGEQARRASRGLVGQAGLFAASAARFVARGSRRLAARSDPSRPISHTKE
jgi:hypothetical protein